jgi:gliding motility-associated-like protein
MNIFEKSIAIWILTMTFSQSAFSQALVAGVESKPAAVNDTIKLCGGGQVSFKSNSTGTELGSTYQWIFDMGSPHCSTLSGPISVTFENMGVAQHVQLIITNPNGEQATKNVVVAFQDPIQLNNISLTNVNCHNGNDGAIVVNASSGSNLNYSWAPAVSNSQSAQNLVAGTYHLTITNEYHCYLDSILTITQPNPLWSMIWAFPKPDCDQANGILHMTGGGGVGPWSQTWSNGAHSQDLANIEAGTYSLTITDAHQCTYSQEYTVACVGLNQLIVPSFISPNGDGLNDFWIIENLEQYLSVSVKIYNRWGSPVYWTEQYTNNWAGTPKTSSTDAVLPAGTYYYFIDTHTGGQEPITGTLEIQP